MKEEITLNKEQIWDLTQLINLCLSLTRKDLNREDCKISSTNLHPKEHIKQEIKRLLDVDINWEV